MPGPPPKNLILTGYACPICGMRHASLPLKFSVKAPLAVTAIPVDELEKRVVITPDQCVIDGRDFYLRGRIVLPVHGSKDPFVWGVWAEVSPKSFLRTNHLWKTEGRENQPSFPGWLHTELPLYGNTLNLEVSVETQPVGRRPHFLVSDPQHPLAIEQSQGISQERAGEIAAEVLHAEEKAAENKTPHIP